MIFVMLKKFSYPYHQFAVINGNLINENLIEGKTNDGLVMANSNLINCERNETAIPNAILGNGSLSNGSLNQVNSNIMNGNIANGKIELHYECEQVGIMGMPMQQRSDFSIKLTQSIDLI